MADTAYTNIALPAHTDNTYFTEPAGLQAFHLLSHQPAPGASPDEAASGGKSLLVDGFNAARILREEDRRAFEVLCKVRLPWHASGNEGITIAPDRRYPVLEIGTNLTQPFRVRWNNDDRGVVPFSEGFEVGQWYDAARKWNEILKRKDSEFWFQLEPGTVLSTYTQSEWRRGPSNGSIVFDNWRVLHGRSAFSGIRRICGGYSK
jgi:trimethyllysine dioxygenase